MWFFFFLLLAEQYYFTCTRNEINSMTRKWGRVLVRFFFLFLFLEIDNIRALSFPRNNLFYTFNRSNDCSDCIDIYNTRFNIRIVSRLDNSTIGLFISFLRRNWFDNRSNSRDAFNPHSTKAFYQTIPFFSQKRISNRIAQIYV